MIANRSSDNIDDRIDSAYLVKMNLVFRFAVNSSLGIG